MIEACWFHKVSTMHKLNNLLKSIKPDEDEIEKDKGLSRGKTEKSELEILVQRRHDEVHKKALYHWQLLRESVCSVKKVLLSFLTF